MPFIFNILYFVMYFFWGLFISILSDNPIFSFTLIQYLSTENLKETILPCEDPADLACADPNAATEEVADPGVVDEGVTEPEPEPDVTSEAIPEPPP
jgi:hypothetical protein